MLTLIFVTCSLAGVDCHPTPVATGFATPMACLMASQYILPLYLKDNPDRVFIRTVCLNLKERQA
jgi:hypothetical protein